MTKAIFLDRDGVVNKEIGNYAYQENDFVINNNLGVFLKELKQKDFIFIIISNQGGIGKGLYTKETVDYLHTKVVKELQEFDVEITAFFYCPHHPQTTKCLCRKPNSLLLEKAIAKYKINKTTSYFIGDSQRDVEAAIKAGVQPIKINANDNLMDYINLF
jgi:D-glycero-D-manno-heptose 1,7-bisphosphate phosphatase